MKIHYNMQKGHGFYILVFIKQQDLDVYFSSIRSHTNELQMYFQD